MTLSPILNSVVSENTEKINLKEVLEDNFSEKEFICELCGKVFKDKLFLISHLNCHSTEGTVEGSFGSFIILICKKNGVALSQL